MWIGNYICLRKICDTEIIILKNTILVLKNDIKIERKEPFERSEEDLFF